MSGPTPHFTGEVIKAQRGQLTAQGHAIICPREASQSFSSQVSGPVWCAGCSTSPGSQVRRTPVGAQHLRSAGPPPRGGQASALCPSAPLVLQKGQTKKWQPGWLLRVGLRERKGTGTEKDWKGGEHKENQEAGEGRLRILGSSMSFFLLSPKWPPLTSSLQSSDVPGSYTEYIYDGLLRLPRGVLALYPCR